MNTVNFDDPNFITTNTYKDFINRNSSYGYLNIRAYAASNAIPISGLKVIVSKILDNERVVFFSGTTDESGAIESITLPTPLVSSNDEVIPSSQDYDIEATYENQRLLYKITMYSNISVNQNINVVPNIRLDGSVYGS